MAKFIEVTCKDEKWLLNANIIEQVTEKDSGSIIYLAYDCPGAYEQDYMIVQESYEQVRQMLIGGKVDG